MAAPALAQSVEDAAELQCYLSNGLTTWDIRDIEETNGDWVVGCDGCSQGVQVKLNYCSYIEG